MRQEETSLATLTTTRAVFDLAVRINDVLEALSLSVVNERYQLLNSRFFAGLDPTLGKGIILEDALGKVSEISCGLVHSWDVSASPCSSLVGLIAGV